MEELSSILEGKTVPTTETPPEKVENTDRDDKGRFTKGEVAEPPTAKTEQPETHVPVKALQEERRKRQEAERRLAEREQAPPPDPIENPAGYAAHVQNDVHFHLFNERLNLSQAIEEDKHGAEAVQEAQSLFQQAAEEDPSLVQRLHKERHPYAFVMKWAKNHKFASQMGDDPEAYIAKRIEEERQKWTAQKPTPKVPSSSLASVPSAKVDTPAFSGHTPLNSIFKKR